MLTFHGWKISAENTLIGNEKHMWIAFSKQPLMFSELDAIPSLIIEDGYNLFVLKHI